MNKYNSPKSGWHRNVMMYADLIGNYKKYKIKSLYDNISDVEIGTGIYSTEGNGRQTPWYYVDAEGKGHYTVGQQPQPFIKPAIEENRTKIINCFKGILE